LKKFESIESLRGFEVIEFYIESLGVAPNYSSNKILSQCFSLKKTTALCAKGQGLRPGKLPQGKVFSGKVFLAPSGLSQSRVVHLLKPVRGLSQVPKGSRPKQKKKKN
jgi:hypothetical protein